MTLKSLRMGIDIADNGDLSTGFTAEGDDVSAEEVVVALLTAAESVLRREILAEMQADNPLGNEDFQRATARLEARVLLMDLVCHLPERDTDGVISGIE
jgi:hypothetical protein